MSMINTATPEWHALCDECPARSKQRANQSDVPIDWKSRMRSLRCPECERDYQEAMIERARLMSKFHMDEKDARKKHTFTGEQLARLLTGTIESFIEYQVREPEDVAVIYTVNEVLEKLDKRVTYD